MSSANISNLESKNKAYAGGFTQGDLALPPAKKYLVLTCMDARIDPAAAFGIGLGDAHVIRNAGASARDAIRSIVISQQLLGTKEVILVKHTGCGMLTFSNNDARGIVEKNLGAEASKELGDLDFLPFPEKVQAVQKEQWQGSLPDPQSIDAYKRRLESAVKADIDYLRGSKLVPDDITLSGWVYSVESGQTKRVV